MPSNKNRLYVVLYARGGTAHRDPKVEERFHFALAVGPKVETLESRGTLFEAKDPSGRWEFEERDISVIKSGMMLARVVVAKIIDDKRLKDVVRGVAVVQGDSTWNCVSWVEDALQAIRGDGKVVGTSMLEWDLVEQRARDYVKEKKAGNRYNAKAPGGTFDMAFTPTYDMLQGKEIVR
ncbi:MAG: hypothetical protein Q9168_007667 [Polycauliona sp. 1 TL-2023]